MCLHICSYLSAGISQQEGLAVAMIARDDPPPSFTRNHGIIPSDDPGVALSVSSKDTHLSQACKGIRDPLHPVTTMHKRHRQTDNHWHRSISAIYITSRTKNQMTNLRQILVPCWLHACVYVIWWRYFMYFWFLSMTLCMTHKLEIYRKYVTKGPSSG